MPITSSGKHVLASRAALMALVATLLALATWAYGAGLKGPFLFDDFGSLPALGATGPVTDLPSLLRYVTAGHADPTGRPLALLSFLLDARNWPASPLPFKRTNLIIHLLNGVLLGLLLWRLGRHLRPAGPRPAHAAVLAAALWLLHPLFVSTTLYIVQREAMLAAGFVLLGLLAWLRGRDRLAAGHGLSGTLWLLTGLGLGTLLATLSKANGALLPLLAGVLELALLRQAAPIADAHARQHYRRAMWLLSGLPALVLLTYLAWRGVDGVLHGTGVRPWSEWQRLLTEPRILLDYLGLLWLPRPFSTGLFNDAYPWSHTLWQPLTTLPALLAVLGLLLAAWRLRRRLPLLAAAVLFYFAGQLLESTTLPLELYFEHRNYLPAVLMFWPLAWWLVDLRQIKAVKLALVVALPLALAALTHTRAGIWGDATEQALIWARVNPHSPRAQAYAAQFEVAHGQAAAAVARLRPLLAQDPSQVQLAFNLLAARCHTGGVTTDDLTAAERAMRTTPNPSSLLTSWFGRALPLAERGRCPGLDLDALRTLVRAGLANPRLWQVPGRRQDLEYLKGRIALAAGHPQQAEQAFARALAYSVRPGFAAATAALLGETGHPALGLALLNRYRNATAQRPEPGFGMARLHAWVLHRQRYWPHELARLRATLDADATQRGNPPMKPSL